MLEGLVRQVVAEHLARAGRFQQLHRAVGLDRAARVHGHRGRAAGVHPLRELLGEGALIGLVEQGAEVLHELGVRGLARLHSRAPLVLACSQLHAVGGEAIVHQLRAHALRV